MGRSGVILFVAISTITISQVWGACSDYVAYYNAPDGKSKDSMDVDVGDRCNYDTNKDGESYPRPKGKGSGIDKLVKSSSSSSLRAVLGICPHHPPIKLRLLRRTLDLFSI